VGSIVIICKIPDKIKQLLNDISEFGEGIEIQNQIQKLYNESCRKLQECLSTNGYLYQFPNMDAQIPTRIVYSKNTRKFVINGIYVITLRLYQYRSQDRQHSEDILMEPFYPSMKVSIYDIYRILHTRTSNEIDDSDPYVTVLSKRAVYTIRQKFQSQWKNLFNNARMQMDSFEDFYNALHQLTTDQLYSLFNTLIRFV